MKELFYNVINLFVILLQDVSSNYCGLSEGPSSSCIGYINVTLNYEDKVKLLSRINFRRSLAARGQLRSFPPATNMLKMRWVEELAYSAQRWADQCKLPNIPEEEDTCLNLYSISVGQCIATLVGEAPGLRAESLADTWYMQSLHFDGNVTNYIPSKSSQSRSYNEFAQMLWADASMVGCGRSRFMGNFGGRLRTIERLVCNFSPRGPTRGAALWTPGFASANCPPKTFRDVDSLCTYREDIEYHTRKATNNVRTVKKQIIYSTDSPSHVTLNNGLGDYFSEPETAQELEELVRRLDQALSNTMPTVAKVRRELRKLPVTKSESTNYEPKYGQLPINENIQNDSLTDRAPVMKMVMRYMPILRQYQSSFSGGSKLCDVNNTYFMILLSIFISKI